MTDGMKTFVLLGAGPALGIGYLLVSITRDILRRRRELRAMAERDLATRPRVRAEHPTPNIQHPTSNGGRSTR